jgi:hypothetical protein
VIAQALTSYKHIAAASGTKEQLNGNAHTATPALGRSGMHS